MLRYSRFVRSMFVIVLITEGGRVAVSDELFMGYEVDVGYSGPVHYRLPSYHHSMITSTNLDDSQMPRGPSYEHWSFDLTPREFLAKVSPNLVLDSSSRVYISWAQSGKYSIGYVAPLDSSGREDPSRLTRLFISDGVDFRSSQTSSALDIDYPAMTGSSLLNENGQFVFHGIGKNFYYDFGTATRTEMPTLGLGPIEWIATSGIDNQGTVVGTATAPDDQGNYVRHAFRYSNGVMTDLNDLVMLNDELVLVQAYDLTETGEIIARMANTWSGHEDWVKLTPALVPEPSSLMIGLAGIAAAAWKFRKHRETTAG